VPTSACKGTFAVLNTFCRRNAACNRGLTIKKDHHPDKATFLATADAAATALAELPLCTAVPATPSI